MKLVVRGTPTRATEWLAAQFATAGVETQYTGINDITDGTDGLVAVMDDGFRAPLAQWNERKRDPKDIVTRNNALCMAWRTREGYVIPLDDPSGFYSSGYWDRDYFRLYPSVAPGGEMFVCEYRGPAAEWHGFRDVIGELWRRFKPRTMLDVGCGCGSFVDHAVRQGIDALGIDISEHAIQHAVGMSQTRLRVADVRDTKEVHPADLVTACDLLEHIYDEDVDGVIDGLLNATKQDLFMCICVARRPLDVWSHKKGTDVPLERAWTAVSGHVNVRPHAYWVGKFQRTGFRVNWEAMHRFAQFMQLHQELKQVESWSAANILIVSRA